MNRAIPELSADVKLLAARLAKCERGDVVTFEEMTSIVGRDIRKHRGILTSARRIVLRDNRLVFESVLKVGMKCMENDSLSSVGTSFISRTSRGARRAEQKMATVEYEKLSNGSRVKHNVAASMLAAVGMMTRSSEVKKLETVIEKRNEPMPTAETLKLFSK